MKRNVHVENLLRYWVILDNLRIDKTDFDNAYNASNRLTYNHDIGTTVQYFGDVIEKMLYLCYKVIERARSEGGLSDNDLAVIDKFEQENGSAY